MGNALWSSSVEVSRPIRSCSDTQPGTAAPCLVIALHGYGMTAARMLEWTRQLVGYEPALVAVEAPNAAYLGPDPRASGTGYNWGIRETTEFHIGFHHRIVSSILKQAWHAFPIGPRRTVLAGFSQPVGLNYRYAAGFPENIGGLLALCGGVPEQWDQDAVQPLPLSVLHIARTQDEFYPLETIDVFDQRLRRSVRDVTMLRLAGKHRFPLQASADVRSWLSRFSESPA
jgi:predicted esterase